MEMRFPILLMGALIGICFTLMISSVNPLIFIPGFIFPILATILVYFKAKRHYLKYYLFGLLLGFLIMTDIFQFIDVPPIQNQQLPFNIVEGKQNQQLPFNIVEGKNG